MSKLDDAIDNTAYILDSLMTLRHIYNAGCCNSCKEVDGCQYKPRIGELARYNCPFYKSK